jgi:two-component system response regulator YesN
MMTTAASTGRCNPLRNKKILLIDDQRSHLRMMKQMLEKLDWCASTVDSAEEAELILEWNPEFNALITDLKMPWLNGLDFCKKTKEKYPDIKIYALSGNLRAYDRDELEAAGFDGIYQKPIRFEIIVDILNAIEGNASDRN